MKKQKKFALSGVRFYSRLMENTFSATATATATRSTLSELLSWEQICRRHPNEWVILIDTFEHGWDIAGGRVLAHGPDMHALLDTAHAARARHGCVSRYWTGHGQNRWKFRAHGR